VIAGLATAIIGASVEHHVRHGAHPMPLVALVPLDHGPVTGLLRVAGVISPGEEVAVRLPVNGRVLMIAAAPGEHVERGALLARLDSLDARAELAAAQSRLIAAETAALQAELAYSRAAQDDADDGRMMIAEARVLSALSEVKAREAAYDNDRRAVRAEVVRAPLAGTIVSRRAVPGEDVPAGAALFTIAPAGTAPCLDVTAPETVVARLALDQSAEFSVPALPGRVFEARVARIGPLERSADGAPHAPVRLDVRGARHGLAFGMTANVVITGTPTRTALRAPVSALAYAPRAWPAPTAEPAVWARLPGSDALRRVRVETGASDGHYVEVASPELDDRAEVAIATLGTASPDR
jgi:RND family efflux transporter MFP subunit